MTVSATGCLMANVKPGKYPVSRRALLGGLGAAMLVPRWTAAASSSYSLKNARLLIGDGTEVRGGLRVEAGLITAVGPEVTSGEDLGGAVLWPGMYNSGCDLGLVEVDQEGGTRDDADGAAVSPQVRVVDAYNPRSLAIAVSRFDGVVGALVLPGDRLVAGQGAWLRTLGDTVDDALIQAPAGLVVRLGRGGLSGTDAPSSRMGAAAKLRELLENAEDDDEDVGREEGWRKKRRLRSRDEDEDDDEDDEEDRDEDDDDHEDDHEDDDAEGEAADVGAGELSPGDRVLRQVRRGRLKVLIAADRASDLLVALSIIDEFKLDAMLLGAAEGHLVAGAIAEAGVPVLLGPVTTQPSSFDTLNARYDNAALLHRAGVRLAIRAPGHHNIRNLNLDAGLAARAGLPPEVALAAITGNGPGFFGLKVGLLRPGYEGTCVLSDGDPLQPRTAHRRVWVRGVEAPMVSYQTELRDRFRSLW